MSVVLPISRLSEVGVIRSQRYVCHSICSKSPTIIDDIFQKLEKDGLMTALSEAIIKGKTTYSVSNLGIPGLRHFLYKSRSHVQITMPEFEDPYDNLDERRRLITLYQTLHDAIHAKSGQGSTLKLQYIRTDRESVMGWVSGL